jgi:hypothetical protein
VIRNKKETREKKKSQNLQDHIAAYLSDDRGKVFPYLAVKTVWGLLEIAIWPPCSLLP